MPPVAINQPAVKKSERKTTSWKDGNRKIDGPTKGSSAGVNTILADITRQEGGKIASTKRNDMKKSPVERRHNKGELM